MKSLVLGVAITVLASSSTGCSGKQAVAGGLVLAAAGAVSIYGASQMFPDNCQDDFECGSSYLLGGWVIQGLGYALGATAVVSGLTLAAVNADDGESSAPVQSTHDDLYRAPTATFDDEPTAVAPASSASVTPASSTTQASVAPASSSTAALAPVVAESRYEPLPAERAIRSRPENQLAIQASLIARSGNCNAAVITGKRLRGLDRDLYNKLVAVDTAFARCVKN